MPMFMLDQLSTKYALKYIPEVKHSIMSTDFETAEGDLKAQFDVRNYHNLI